jgi:DNA-binding NtrC family response regulator
MEAASAPLRVLVVEDDPSVRFMYGRILSERFSCVYASTWDAAIQEIERGGNWDLLLTDLDLKEKLNGLGLVYRIREQMPWLPVVMASGHPPSDPRIQLFLKLRFVQFIGKESMRSELPRLLDVLVDRISREREEHYFKNKQGSISLLEELLARTQGSEVRAKLQQKIDAQRSALERLTPKTDPWA